METLPLLKHFSCWCNWTNSIGSFGMFCKEKSIWQSLLWIIWTLLWIENWRESSMVSLSCVSIRNILNGFMMLLTLYFKVLRIVVHATKMRRTTMWCFRVKKEEKEMWKYCEIRRFFYGGGPGKWQMYGGSDKHPDVKLEVHYWIGD